MKHPLDQMAQRCYKDNKEKGFWETPTWATMATPEGTEVLPDYTLLKKMEKLGLIFTELCEGIEGLRKNLPSDKIEGFSAEEEELADAVIRIFDYCGAYGIRLGEAFEAKLKYNRERPHKHGKAF